VAVLIGAYAVVLAGEEGWSLSIILPMLLITVVTLAGALAVIPLNEAIWRRIVEWYQRDGGPGGDHPG
jgi:hypothetical protein